MKLRRFSLLFAALLAACGDAEVDSGGDTLMTNEQLAVAHCDAFSMDDVPMVDGTASPREMLTADGVVKQMKLGPITEPDGYVGNTTLHVEEAGRYALVVYEDPATNTAGISFFEGLSGGPEPAGFQECAGCNRSCEAVSNAASYDLAAGDYRFFIRNDIYSTVRFVLAPVTAP